ncbi:MAG TPA: hypothetical protein VNO26_04770 [Candidatus Limnocylindria bacterium]|nr:hypothetical protein [Candidatus Limnocylindria bacterium]
MLPALVAALWVTAAAADDGKLTRALRVEQAVTANLVPLSPAYITSKCLVPYPLCKLAYASAALVSSWEQLLVGGDVDGAQKTIGRGLGGPWVVRPANVSGAPLWSLPFPAPLVAYFVTGRNNEGSIALDPLPATRRPDGEAGDVLPP